MEEIKLPTSSGDTVILSLNDSKTELDIESNYAYLDTLNKDDVAGLIKVLTEVHERMK